VRGTFGERIEWRVSKELGWMDIENQVWDEERNI
jgi:hypothetical protein